MYTEENLKILVTKQKKSLVLTVVFAVLFCVAVSLTLIFVNRNNKIIVQIIGTIISLITLFLFIFFITFYFDIKKQIALFETIKNNEGKKEEMIFVRQDDKPITLTAGNKVYVCFFLNENKEQAYYLSTLFNFDFIKDKKYIINHAEEYIKEIENEL